MWNFVSSLQCHCKRCQTPGHGCSEWHAGEGEAGCWVRPLTDAPGQDLSNSQVGWENKAERWAFIQLRHLSFLGRTALSVQGTQRGFGEKTCFSQVPSVCLINHVKNKTESKGKNHDTEVAELYCAIPHISQNHQHVFIKRQPVDWDLSSAEPCYLPLPTHKAIFDMR